ncbi:uncharacterized protein si:dkey-29p10.4 isoform X2 [Betta splendens]|uniref:Uncharacterized protein si:dkey-29p10.4 isoform X2 n=1 Tax=Betta splendens TaxID=158456 RepID=A0A6P7MQI2_BETSP|nr:uncharacterized protein si:dkey-29p10.4 isoform X2 [Betta splendens]
MVFTTCVECAFKNRPGQRKRNSNIWPRPAALSADKQKANSGRTNMGQSLETPTRCPLCSELTLEPVTLKCNHRFCRRCIGDLWSVHPNGPYHCPEWRCKTVYQTPPFDDSSIRPPASGGRNQASSSAATSTNSEQTFLDSLLRRPSLTRHLLGKRKASAPAPEQPDRKRSTVASPQAPSDHTDTPAPSAASESSEKAADAEPRQPEDGHGKSTSKAASARDTQQELSVQQNKPKSEDVITLGDSDSSSEVDICDAPPPATPGKDTQAIGMKSVSPANSNSFPGVSTPGTDEPLSRDFSRTPLIFPKHPTAPSGSSSHLGVFSRSGSKNACSVPCHYCPKSRCQHAVKSCLVCGASMCAEHLRPHLDSPVFQNHTLVPPMEDISLWRCQEHQEINRIYCRQCGVCVCTVCTVIGSHRDHVCISVRDAERELRGNLKEEIKQLQDTEQQVKNRLNELTEKKETFTVVLTEAQKGVQQQYGAIREALEKEEQSALQCVKKEETRVLGALEEKLGHLRSALQSVQQGLHTLEELADTKGDKCVQDQAFIMEYSKIAQLTSNMEGCVDRFEAPEEVDQARLKCLQSWTEKRLDTVVTVADQDRDLYRLQYGTIPLMDADTAHPKLQLSDNNRKVAYVEAQQAYAEHGARFSCFPQVLAARALQGGRWYWEVNVSMDDGRWKEEGGGSAQQGVCSCGRGRAAAGRRVPGL